MRRAVKTKRRQGPGRRAPVAPEMRSEPEREHIEALMREVAEPRTHPCVRCGAPIDDRFPAFPDCTKCAITTNNEAIAPWREQQREVSRTRIAKMKEELANADLE